MYSIRKGIVRHVPERADQRQIRSEVEVFGRRTSGRWNHEREFLPLGLSTGPASERLLEQRRGRGPPVFTERRCSEDPIQRLVLNRGIKHARTQSNTGLARSADDLTQKSF